MKIAFIRGPFLNPWELQTYLPLAEHHEFKAVGADWQVFSQAFGGLPLPVEHPHVQKGTFLNRLRSWTLGESYGLSDLEKAVGDAQILHSAETFSTMTYQCLQIRKRRPCKVVATIWENLPGMGELHPRRRARKYQAMRELDGFLSVTETSRKMLLAEGAPADRIEVIPMAVDLSHFKPAPKDAAWLRQWGVSPKDKIVLFIGRWVEEKGIRELLEAVPEVLKSASGVVRFCFVGSGPLEGLLRQARSKHADHVMLVPFAPYDQLPVLHNIADVFVLPSKPMPKWEEQFGYVLVESMACAKAIITTRSGSIPDVVGDAAVLVSPGSAQELAAALVGLLNSDSEQQRLGAMARERAQSEFDAQKNARRIEVFYERILQQPS